MKYMYLLLPLHNGHRIEKWEIMHKEYNNGWIYHIEPTDISLLSDKYDSLIIDEVYLANNKNLIVAFSPKCVLLKYIMYLGDIIIKYTDLHGLVEILYKNLSKAKAELKNYD